MDATALSMARRRPRGDLPPFALAASNIAGAPGSATEANPNWYATGLWSPDVNNSGEFFPQPTSATLQDWAPILLFLAVLAAIVWGWRSGYVRSFVSRAARESFI